MKKTRAPKHPPAVSIDGVIHTIRGERVILDADLAVIYGVKTKRLNEQVKRNLKRFPADFLFQLTREEFIAMRSQSVTASGQFVDHKSSRHLRSQFATSSSGYGGQRYLPYAFTENGAVMAANVLNSPEAVRMSVHVVRAFIQMRALLAGSAELAAELKKLEAKLTSRLDTHEVAITEVLRRIMLLLDPPPSPVVPDKQMGFHTTMPKPAKR